MNKLLLTFFLTISLSCVSIKAAEGSVPKLIDENKIWEYISIDSYALETKFSLDRFVFDGTEEIGDYTYHKWTQIGSCQWNNFNNEMKESTAKTVKALMREDGDGNVYLLLDKGTYRTFLSPDEGLSEPIDITEPKEVLLYDFNKGVDESFISCVGLFMSNVTGVINNVISHCKVVEEEEIEVDARKTKKFIACPNVYPYILENLNYDLSSNLPQGENHIWDYAAQTQIYYLEGIGNIGRGNMTEIYQEDELFTTTSNYYINQGINNVYDLEGNVLYVGSGYKAPSLGSILEVESTFSDAKIYDLFGRVITSPLPGSIYIKDGKKYIGK